MTLSKPGEWEYEIAAPASRDRNDPASNMISGGELNEARAIHGHCESRMAGRSNLIEHPEWKLICHTFILYIAMFYTSTALLSGK
jgi:hypothetical protein